MKRRTALFAAGWFLMSGCVAVPDKKGWSATATIGYVTVKKVPTPFWKLFRDDTNRYRMELLLDDGRVFDVALEDPNVYRAGDRVVIRYRGNRVLEIRPLEAGGR